MACPFSMKCAFYQRIEPHVVMRIRYASSFPYCKGGNHQECALITYVESDSAAPAGLLPTGKQDEGTVAHGSGDTTRSVVVVDSSRVFMRLASAAVRAVDSSAHIIEAHSFDEAAAHIPSADLVVSGSELGPGHTPFDISRLARPGMPLIVLSSGGDTPVPEGAVVVDHTRGSSALSDVIRRRLNL